jgi:uncharacterized protein with NAD-binding domain and iron-sulfur cluster
MKKKIAILGAGMGSMSTAWHLTKDPGWRARYDVTVYVDGWRIGGKGASSVNPSRNGRIEEHGLHLLFGFYRNALPLLEEVYKELGRPAGTHLASYRDALAGEDTVVAYDPSARGSPLWLLRLPNRAGVAPLGSTSGWGFVRALALETQALAAGAGLGVAAAVAGWVASITGHVSDPGPGPARTLVATAAHAVQLAANALLGGPITLPDDERRLLILVDLAATVARGMLDDFRDLDDTDWFQLDGETFEAWLARHGADIQTWQSGPVAILRQIAFSETVGVGAGTTLHWAMHLVLDYDDSFMFRMNAGMGETVFVPMYEVLRNRGVKFAFFHRVTKVEQSAGTITRVEIARPMEVRVPPYQPLIDQDGLLRFPERPLTAQLVNGAALDAALNADPIANDLENAWKSFADQGAPITLQRGVDFDYVVLGISVGALAGICPTLMADPLRPKFGAMVRGLQTTLIASAQVWFKRDAAQLGFTTRTMLAGNAPAPLDTWADMSHLLAQEEWPPAEANSITYLVAGIDDLAPAPAPGTPDPYVATQTQRAFAALQTWANNHARTLFPAAVNPGGALDPNELSVFPGVPSPPLEQQFWRVPHNLSERYVLAAPNTNPYRLLPRACAPRRTSACGSPSPAAAAWGRRRSCCSSTPTSGSTRRWRWWPGGRSSASRRAWRASRGPGSGARARGTPAGWPARGSAPARTTSGGRAVCSRSPRRRRSLVGCSRASPDCSPCSGA